MGEEWTNKLLNIEKCWKNVEIPALHKYTILRKLNTKKF